MELREYQKKVTTKLSQYLTELVSERERFMRVLEADAELANDIHYPAKAWKKIGLEDYQKSFNGISQPTPNLYFKVPTGGGKTLLATHSIDLINKVYLNKQNGMVLWIVPTTQIYKQTLIALRDRNHPYRQVLDVSSGGKTLILEKTDRFTPDDVAENLCVMLLMLPSAARQSKETLKVFKDNSGYTEFFPAEDAYRLHEELMARVPNLDTFGEEGYIWGNLPKTSLGNTLKLLNPITIIDEGHKAYTENARNTIFGFNPSFVLELSATPPENANKLVEITGKELNDEEMIKLDLHLVNKTTAGWKETLAESVSMRADLETKAKEYEQNTDNHIRPITLVQVERTGKDQRDGNYIHAEDVKEYLIKQANIPEEQIAIKSSEKDDIEGIDLLSKDCSIRFIITKQALQEGWDCPFAYVLCALTKSQSETAMTQLIGRVLRQPYARKTGIKALDECYVYSFQHDTAKLVKGIKQNLEGEGLGDLVGRISVDTEDDGNPDFLQPKKTEYRDDFKKFAGKIFLPVFAIDDGLGWREVRYSTDILSRIKWSKASLGSLSQLVLMNKSTDDIAVSVSVDDDGKPVSRTVAERSYESKIDSEYIARQVIDIVPNPWVAYEIANKAVEIMLKDNDIEVLASNLVFFIEHLRALLLIERDRLAEEVFRSLLGSDELKLYLIGDTPLRSTATVRSKQRMRDLHDEELQRSLFDYVPSEDMNNLEEAVGLYLDEQEQLLWWYRNLAKADYRIQGWKPNRIYPDFLAAEQSSTDKTDYSKVYVLESKGDHLARNEDTEYKRTVLDLCNELAVETSWNELDTGQFDKVFHFEMLDEKSWKSQLNNLLTGKSETTMKTKRN
ncbi:MAG: DEAD/DEAH box helicase family protein [Candidatus Saccharimonadales bacterium]